MEISLELRIITTEAEVLEALVAFDDTTWVFKRRPPRNARSDEAGTGVYLVSTLVNAFSINGVGSDVAFSSTPDAGQEIVPRPRERERAAGT